MKQRLMVLNVVLMVTIVFAGWQLRQNWLAARARQSSVAGRRMKPLAPPVVAPSPVPKPVTATGYADVVQKMLFSKDRNPTVEIPEAPAPIPKPMPPLPILYGVMDLLDGTTAIMSTKAGAQHKGVRSGDRVGEFTLVAVDSQEITLEWDGKTVTKPLDEMIDRSAPPPVDAAAARTGAAVSAARTPQPAAPAPTPKGEAAPGKDVGNKLRACQPGDSSPPGTTNGGYRKVVTQSPFGDMCRWEPL